jgi:hypothetical protein
MGGSNKSLLSPTAVCVIRAVRVDPVRWQSPDTEKRTMTEGNREQNGTMADVPVVPAPECRNCGSTETA